jgi:SAM-dependent methyltransferase
MNPLFGPNGEKVVVSGRSFPSFARVEIHPAVANILSPMCRGKLLDLPTGSGALAWRLHVLGFEVTGADLYPDYFCNPELKVVKADLTEKFPFDDGAFDYATFVEGPEHCENIYQPLREFSRILKIGGKLIVTIPNYSNLQSRLKNLFYGASEPIVSDKTRRESFVGKEHMIHINRPTYPLLRMALEYAGFHLDSLHRDKVKKGQNLLAPLALIISGLAKLKGRKGEDRYWMASGNAPEILMGGNTLIIVATKRDITSG